MNYSDTDFKDLKFICTQSYGNEKGLCIYHKAEENFRKMKIEAEYRNSDVIKWHMTMYIFPSMHIICLYLNMVF